MKHAPMSHKGSDWIAFLVDCKAKDNLLILFKLAMTEADGYIIIKDREFPFSSVILIVLYKFTQSHLSQD